MKKTIFACIPFVLLLCACALENGNVTGPAGGYVFYDKGNYNDGWRYLEASPKDAGEAEWRRNTDNINLGTSSSMGSGKQNTDLILAAVKAGESNTAAQLCAEFTYGGYTDWFLPSEEELKQMMKTASHLFESGEDYWTSTQYNENSSYKYYAKYVYHSGGDVSWSYAGWINTCNVRPARRF